MNIRSVVRATLAVILIPAAFALLYALSFYGYISFGIGDRFVNDVSAHRPGTLRDAASIVTVSRFVLAPLSLLIVAVLSSRVRASLTIPFVVCAATAGLFAGWPSPSAMMLLTIAYLMELLVIHAVTRVLVRATPKHGTT